MFRILIHDPDRLAIQDYRRALIAAGYTVRTISSAGEAGEIVANEETDLLITETGPEDEGVQLIHSIRQALSHLPIMVVTERDELSDMKKAFHAGADDYMIKPVRNEELVLRVRALLRRSGLLDGDRKVLGRTSVDYASMTVDTPDGSVMLPQKEFLLLYTMFSFPGRAFPKQQLKDEIWGFESNSDMHTVEVHIGRLRDKFISNRDFRIVTVRGIGYKVIPLQTDVS